MGRRRIIVMNKEYDYWVGMAEVDITPPVGIKLAGFAALTDPSTGVELPLKATTLYWEDRYGGRILLLSAEWLGFYDRADYVRSKIAQATGIPETSIILSGTHTHAGPCIREMDEWRKGACDRDYFERVVSRMTEASIHALTEREPMHVYFTKEAFPLAISRRRLNAEGLAEWGPNRNAWVDETLSVLQFRRVSDHSLKGLFFSYACHPTSRQTLKIGGDYVGFTYRRLKERYPGVVSGFLQGFAGDVKPAFLSPDGQRFRQVDSDEIDRLALRMCDAITAQLETGMGRQLEGPLRSRFERVALPLLRPSPALHRRFLESDQEVTRQWAEHFPADGEAPEPDPVPFEVQCVAVGRSLALVFLAGEVSVGYSRKIRAMCAGLFADVLPVAYSNAMVGYVPLAEQIPEGGYEVWYAHQYHRRPGFFDERTEKIIVKNIHQQLTCLAQGEE